MLDGTMSLLDRIKGAVGMDDDVELHTYQCTVCQTTFESADPNPGAVACTSCGSADVSTVEGA